MASGVKRICEYQLLTRLTFEIFNLTIPIPWGETKKTHENRNFQLFVDSLFFLSRILALSKRGICADQGDQACQSVKGPVLDFRVTLLKVFLENAFLFACPSPKIGTLKTFHFNQVIFLPN